MKKKAKSTSKKKGSGKAKASAKAKSSAKSKARRSAKASAIKASSRGKARTRRSQERAVPQGSQSVETVPLKRRALRARAGAGGGDFGGVSAVESVENESADELLEEGQAFEAGIVSGVEDAPNADEGPIRTREVPQDDVPEEYEGQDRPGER